MGQREDRQREDSKREDRQAGTVRRVTIKRETSEGSGKQASVRQAGEQASTCSRVTWRLQKGQASDKSIPDAGWQMSESSEYADVLSYM